MTAADRREFAAFLLGLGEAYGEAVSEARMEIYFAALSDLELSQIRQAANVHVRTQKFFPRASELRDAIVGTAEDRADLAWVEMRKLVRQVGYYGTPTWTDPALKRAALELYGGWQALCEYLPASGPELLGVAKLFKATYTAYSRRDERLALPGHDDARARLTDLGRELERRGLPAPGLPS